MLGEVVLSQPSARVDHLPQILIVEPDAVTARVLVRECGRLRRSRLIDSAAQATALLESGPKLTALVTEQVLPDGSGTALVAAFRSVHPLMPALILTAETKPAVINRAHALGAEFVAKPARRDNLRRFLRRAVAFERVPDHRVALVMEELVRRSSLSPRETDLLAAAVVGTPRRVIADQIGTTENTIKSCVKSLLRKCDATTLEVVVRSIWMKALAGSDARGESEQERYSILPGSPFTIPPPTVNEEAERHTAG